MSNKLRTYYPNEGWLLHVNAFIGENGDHSVQFTMGEKYTQLSQSQVKDLIETLQKRLYCVDGFKATDSDLDIDIGQDGTPIETIDYTGERTQ